MHRKQLIGILVLAAIVVITLFLVTNLNINNIDYVLPRRIKKLLAIVLTGSVIAFSTMVFQTITNNRILTPSIIGLDSLYQLIQVTIIFVFGSTNMMVTNKQLNFLLTIGVMVLFSSLLFRVLFKREGQNVFFVLLVGMVFGTLFSSFTTFMQVLIDPNEFLIVQDKMFASFNNVDTDLLLISFVLSGVVIASCYRELRFLDIISLGRDEAINLGVNYEKVVRKFLFMITVLVAISTALVGPVMFLGLLVVNLARELMKTYKHTYLLVSAALISIIALVGGQFLVERVFTFSTTISVIINFVGGLYFIYLLLKESQQW